MTRNPVGNDRELLREGCLELGVDLSPDRQDSLIRYLDLLYVWNRAAGLTTIAREDAVRLHLLDSLAAVTAIGAGPCLDLGTGAGLPGMALAVACPAETFVLAESNRKKCSFLLEVVRQLGIANVRVVQGDVHALPRKSSPVVTSRAFRPPAEFLSIAGRLVTENGRIVLLMADPADQVLESLAREARMDLEALRRLRLPLGGEPRAIVTFRPA